MKCSTLRAFNISLLYILYLLKNANTKYVFNVINNFCYIIFFVSFANNLYLERCTTTRSGFYVLKMSYQKDWSKLIFSKLPEFLYLNCINFEFVELILSNVQIGQIFEFCRIKKKWDCYSWSIEVPFFNLKSIKTKKIQERELNCGFKKIHILFFPKNIIVW